METLTYILKVNIIFALMYGAYLVFMRRTAFHLLNRCYLLLAPLVALALPGVSSMFRTKALYVVQLPEITPLAGSAASTDGTLPLVQILICLWCLGAAIALGRIARSVFQAQRALKANSDMSFTFLGKVHVPEQLPEDLRSNIVAHEQVHADQLHTLDLFWYSVLRIVFWANPLFRAGSTSLKELHEFIADEYANQNTPNYPEALVANAFGLSVLPMANEFKSVNVKQRIVMLKKKRNNKQGMALVASIGLVAIAALSISWTAMVLPEGVGQKKVYEKVDKMPMYPGCDTKSMGTQELKTCAFNNLVDFMSKEVKYPKSAEKAGTEGTVKVKFVVTSAGSLEKVHALNEVNKELEAEAIRVVKAMPNWVPGEHEGKKVNVAIVLPIKFAL